MTGLALHPFPSPNFGDRRGGARPGLIVLHYTAMADFSAARARLCDPVAEVSAHWLIDRDGRAEALVAEDARAWHAGAGEWAGSDDVNSRSIGIELVNTGDEPFPEPQMAALERLLPQIMARWSIGPAGVIGHSDFAPERKSDPGRRFDWRRLARQGLAVWPDAPDPALCAPPVDEARFLAALYRFGYPTGDLATRLAAFRLRFRPGASGPLDPLDMRLALGLPAIRG